MKKISQGIILILGGLVGSLGVVVHFQEQKFGIATLLLLGVVTAFGLAWWLIRKGKKELNSN